MTTRINDCYFLWDNFWKHKIAERAEQKNQKLWYEVYIDVSDFLIPTEYNKLLNMNSTKVIDYIYDYCVNQEKNYYSSPKYTEDLNKALKNIKPVKNE